MNLVGVDDGENLGGNDDCIKTPSFESEKSHPHCVDKLTNSKYDPPPRNELATRVFNVPHNTFIHYHITHTSLTNFFTNTIV